MEKPNISELIAVDQKDLKDKGSLDNALASAREDFVIKQPERYDFVTRERLEAKEFTEKEGVQDLINFIEKTRSVASESEHPEAAKILEVTNAFRENLILLTQNELEKGAEKFAQHWLEKLHSGKEIFVYVAGARSERYITLLILEAFDKLCSNKAERGNKLKVSFDTNEIVNSFKKSDNPLIIIADDFAISKTRIRGFASQVLNKLIESGVNEKEAALSIESNLLAMGESKATFGSSEQEMKIVSHLEVPEYKGSDDKWLVFPGISISGTHCTVDYGYEQVLENFREFLNKHNISYKPLLYNIERPYRVVKNDFSSIPKYEDENLQQRWDSIYNKYKLDKKT